MNTFIKRTFTASIFVAVLLGCTYFNQLSFTILFLVITFLGLNEFYSLSEKGNTKPQKIWGTIIGIAIYIINSLICFNKLELRSLALILPLIFSIFIIELFSKKENAFQNIATTILGIIYVTLPFSLLNYIVIYTGIYSYQIIFGMFFILWCNDSGAYIVGSLIGKHKLFPSVSPGKTWEGSIGGVIISLIVAYIIAGWYTSISIIDWAVIAALMTTIGTIGDLVESQFKRSINVKDSGTILPGHGGILDRFDSLLFSIPFVFSYLFLKHFL